MQNNQSKKLSLLSQLALSSQNKFFLKSPPKSRKKAATGQATAPPAVNLVAELDGDTSEGLSPTGHCENYLSAGLDCAISDLVALDSHTEVEQGIFLGEGDYCNKCKAFSVLSYTVTILKSTFLPFQKAYFLSFTSILLHLKWWRFKPVISTNEE